MAVLTWPEAVQRVVAGSPHELSLQRRRLAKFSAVPVTITGAPGAGKTRLWSRLTRRTRPDRASVVTDDGYMVRPHRRAAALTTIPGQRCRERRAALDELFGDHTRLNGVVFVACSGYAEVWHPQAETRANSLNSYDLASLIAWNKREELDNFRDICGRILDKHDAAESLAPRWLLVLVNKLDLYWSDEAAARSYYLPGSNSAFDEVAQQMLSQIGTLNLSYYVLPVAAEASNYEFRSSRGKLTRATSLTNDQCDASLACLVETLGGLTDA